MPLWNYLLFLSLGGSILYTLYIMGIWNSRDIADTLNKIDEIGCLSIVKDIRGTEPYMTLKMSCFIPHIDKNLKTLTGATSCHARVFSKCFQNKSMEGRQETHVIKFIEKTRMTHCTCTDINGWCKAGCAEFPHMRCCLDRGKYSVICRT